MRELTAEQQSLVSARKTMPIYLVDIGGELLSTNGDRDVGEYSYAGADVAVAGIDNWMSARIRLRPSAARVQQVISAAWRGMSCVISLYPAVEHRQLIAPGYYAEGTAIDGFHATDPFVLLDGVLTSAEIGEWVEFEVMHRSAVARWIPPIRITAPLCNHLPKPGTVLVWQGENYTLEAR